MNHLEHPDSIDGIIKEVSAKDTQFNDYSRYDADQIDAAHKVEVHESQFPKDLESAYELGKQLVAACKG